MSIKADSQPSVSATAEVEFSNNTWYLVNESDTAVVFLHGIFSNSNNCWLHKDDEKGAAVFWPALVRSDPAFGNPSIYLAGYYTNIESGNFSIVQCARQVFEAFERISDGATISVLQKRTLIFVCHSTGGIVIRYLLERHVERFRDKAIGLVLIASPSLGSVWANVASLAARYYNQQLGKVLRFGDETLSDIHGRFRDLVNNRLVELPGLFGAEACENQMILRDQLPGWVRKLLPNRLTVVNTVSAGQYFGEVKVLPETDHFTTVKPSGLKHPSHEFLSDFVGKFREFVELDRHIRAIRDGQQLRRVLRRVASSQSGEYDFRNWLVRHVIKNNGSGVLLEECDIVSRQVPITVIQKRYGVDRRDGKQLSVRLRATNALDRLEIPFCELERGDSTVLFAIAVDPPSTAAKTTRIGVECHRDGLWDELLRTGTDEGYVDLRCSCDRLVLQFVAPAGFRWTGIRGSLDVGTIDIETEGGLSVATWKIESLTPRRYTYTLFIQRDETVSLK